MVVFDEPADRIIEAALNAGFPLSRRQLAEWHRHGLIPKPKQLPLGRGKGSASIYRHGTTRQAITCAILMIRFGSLRRVGWELWVLGYPVAERLWRPPLKRAHKAFRFLASYLSDRLDPLGERADTLERIPMR
jgi:hypothetical protein